MLSNNLIVSPTSADPGTTISITPSNYQYYPEYVTLGTIPADIQDFDWDNADKVWSFPMINQDVTIMSQFNTKYTITKAGGYTESWGITDDHFAYSYSLPVGVELRVIPDDPTTINGSSYTCEIQTTGGSYLANAEWTGDSYSYWTATMPAQNIKVYVNNA